MEKNGSIDRHPQPSSFSWLLDNNNRPSKSPWLQTTLAELDWKIKQILEVVEDNGDTFAQRVEMYYQKRPLLIKMVGELHKSYRALADKYDLIMLRSESLRSSNCCCSTSNSFRQPPQRSYNTNSGQMTEPRDSVSECDHQSWSCHDRELIKQQKPTNTAEKKKVMSTVTKVEDSDDDHEHHYDRRNVEEKDVTAAAGVALERQGWDELLAEVSKLIEENASQQAELIRRYNMRREDMKQLVNENRRLTYLLAQTKINVNQQTNANSKWKASTLFGKLLR